LSSGCEGRKEGRKKKKKRDQGLGERVLLFFAGAPDHHPVLQNSSNLEFGLKLVSAERAPESSTKTRNKKQNKTKTKKPTQSNLI
jgi:hypothetical protein